MNVVRVLIFGFALIWLASCASYQGRVDEARSMLERGEYAKAAGLLEPLAEEQGGDQLVYLLDWAMSLYLAGEHERSIEAFLAADNLVDFNDYLSLSQETASLLLGQEMVQYKGTSYEKILINVYLALNFLKLSKLESAAVEMRRLRLRLRQLAERGEKDYDRSFLALYLSALIWEMSGEWDSAIIDYEAAYKLNPGLRVLKEDLVRASYRARRMESHRRYLKDWDMGFNPEQIRSHGQVVIIYEQGWVSRLGISSHNYRLPELYRVPSRVHKLRVSLEGTDGPDKIDKPLLSEVIFSVDQVAHQYMSDIMLPLFTKRLAGIAAKAVAADQVRQKNEVLGNFAWLAMNLSDRADVRQWSTLPESFQLLRLQLPPGNYILRVEGMGHHGEVAREFKPLTLEVRGGEIQIESLRSF